MSFKIQRLVGNRAVISGTDFVGTEGQVIVDTTQWDEINSTKQFDQATEAFEAAVEEFFAPLTEAAEKINKQLARPSDPVGYVVLHEEVEGVQAQSAHIITLTHDSVVLRLVETDPNTSRLMWVGDSLEVLEAGTPLPGIDVEPVEVQAPAAYEG